MLLGLLNLSQNIICNSLISHIIYFYCRFVDIDERELASNDFSSRSIGISSSPLNRYRVGKNLFFRLKSNLVNNYILVTYS